MPPTIQPGQFYRPADEYFSRRHPDTHEPFSKWSEDQTLHVATPYSNPFRWRTRRELLNDYRHHMRNTPNVQLHVGELAYGDRPFEVTGGDPNDVQLRTNFELFHKENIGNAIISRFPNDWQYGAIIDGDFHFTRHDWALEAIHLLQHYDFVQLFSSYSDLSSDLGYGGHRPIRTTASFAYNYVSSGCRLPEGYENGGWKKVTPYYGSEGGQAGARYVGATGGAWAFRRSAFNTVGRLLDVCILGHGDWFMAFGLVSEPAPDMRIGSYTSGYQKAIYQWQNQAALLQKNIGVVDCHAIHYFHGSKSRRGYASRDKILVEHQFDPQVDLKMDYQGIYQLAGNKPRMRDAIRLYFLSRSEDDPNLYGSEKPIT